MNICTVRAEVNDLRLLADGGGITSYEYDRIGRITEVNDIYSRVIGYAYNDLYQRTQMDYPMWSFVLDYDYDNLSRLKKVYSGNWDVVEYEYDSLSRRIRTDYYNDANYVCEYDIAGRLESMTNNFASGSVITAYDNYDDVGNRLSMKVGDANTHAYNYDNLYQLTAVDYNDGNNTSYVYDELGNRKSIDDGTEVSYVSNALNQYSSVGGTGFTYDNNGNLSYDGTYRYYYDCQNRLVDVNDQSDVQVASYAYDYKGRRMLKTVYGSPDVTTTYCYDGDQVIAEFNGSSTVVRMFVYGANIDEPVYIYDATGPQGYYHYDALGSVVALSDVSGNVAESYSYDVYGKPTIRNSSGTIIADSAISNPYMFTARRIDTETANYYYRARYYQPEIGRFLQTDPVGYKDGINWYAYVKNNPIMRTDPLGLGCGEEGHWTDKYIPEQFDDCDFSEACDNHDDCYGRGGGCRRKKRCDNKFMDELLEAVLDGNVSAGCQQALLFYSGAVMGEFGRKAFNKTGCCKKKK